MKFGELFAGFGGIGLGLERAGMECTWQVENDPYCQKVLERHWPQVKRITDVRDAGKHNLEPVDLICGGFPCQPFSVAGKRLRADDDRYLWPQMLRVISEIRPTWVVAENVSGITLNGGVELERVYSGLEATGYEVLPLLDLPSCAFGLPTLERHVWIIATTVGTGWQGDGTNAIPNLDRVSREFRGGDTGNGNRWALPEARVCRVGEGVPYRMERNRGLGNAVPPAMAEWIGERILDSALSGELAR